MQGLSYTDLHGFTIQFVQYPLQLIALCVQHFLVGIRGHVDRRRDVDVRARERFRNLKQVPTRQRPKTIQRHRHGHDWMTRFLCQLHRAHFRDVTRTFWAIDRERRRAPGAHQPRHLDYRAHAAACARTAHRTVTESLNKPCYVLAVETARRHYHDASFAPPVSRQKNTIVPEDVDRKSAVNFYLAVVLPTSDFKSRGTSNQAN